MTPFDIRRRLAGANGPSAEVRDVTLAQVLASPAATWVAALAGCISALVAAFALASSRTQRRLAEQSERNAQASAEAAVTASNTAKEALRQDWATTGNATAISWRTQVIDLHQRGLTATQIRDIFETEGGVSRSPSTGLLNIEEEEWIKNGDIDVIVQTLEAAANQ
jgi:hypothetical protein